MNRRLRWAALAPVVAVAYVTALMLFWPVHTLLMHLCPQSDVFDEGTTNLTQPDYAVIVQSCSAAWFPGAETAALIGVLAAAIVAAACASALMAPAKKVASAFCASCLALLLTFVFLVFPG